MFGRYDGAAVFNLPDSQSRAAVSLAITSSGALSRFETQELIESRDLTAMPNEPKGSPTSRPEPDRRDGLPLSGSPARVDGVVAGIQECQLGHAAIAGQPVEQDPTGCLPRPNETDH
jgi:hypothetical protein